MATGDRDEEEYQQEDKKKIEIVAQHIPVYYGYQGIYCLLSNYFHMPNENTRIPFASLTLTNFFK